MKIERLRFARAIGGRNMNPLSIQKRIRDVLNESVGAIVKLSREVDEDGG